MVFVFCVPLRGLWQHVHSVLKDKTLDVIYEKGFRTALSTLGSPNKKPPPLQQGSSSTKATKIMGGRISLENSQKKFCPHPQSWVGQTRMHMNYSLCSPRSLWARTTPGVVRFWVFSPLKSTWTTVPRHGKSQPVRVRIWVFSPLKSTVATYSPTAWKVSTRTEPGFDPGT